MKYLKSFNESGKRRSKLYIRQLFSKSKMISGSNFDITRKIDEEISNTVLDILLDLKDDGFECHLQVVNYSGKLGIDIYKNDKFVFNDIKSVVNRLCNYLKGFGFIEEFKDLNGFKLPMTGRYWASLVWGFPKIKESKSNVISDSEHNEIIETCEDILLDLKDDGYSFKVHKDTAWIWSKGISIKVKNDNKFTFNDISETINRINGYLNSKGFYMDYVGSDVYKFNAPPIDPNVDRSCYLYQVSFINKPRS